MPSRRASERFGRFAEAVAHFWLSLKGYRILDRRARTAAGEIDPLASKGAILAVVEVKARRSLDEARQALGDRQRSRIVRAVSVWQARHPQFAHLTPRYDLFFMAPARLPVHERAAWLPEGEHAARLL